MPLIFLNVIFWISFPIVGTFANCFSDTTNNNISDNSLKQSFGSSHFIGEEFGGGVIFYLWKDDQEIEHGLIVDKSDLDTACVWSNKKSQLIGASAQNSKDGLKNSEAIVAQTGHKKSAASLCLDSKNGGFDDWYLPAIDELTLLWENRKIVNKTLSEIKEASILKKSTYYWSSTEDESKYALLLFFTIGDNGPEKKDDLNSVRAIRAF
jgi:hypothetical protein